MTERIHKQAFCSLPNCTKCSAAANDLAKMHKTLATLARTILILGRLQFCSGMWLRCLCLVCFGACSSISMSQTSEPLSQPASESSPTRPRKVWKDFGRFTYVCKDQKPVRSSETNFRAAAKAWMDEHRQSRNGTSLGVLSRVWEAGGFLKANCNCVECADCKLGRGQSFRLEWNQDAAEPDTVRLRIFSSGVPST